MQLAYKYNSIRSNKLKFFCTNAYGEHKGGEMEYKGYTGSIEYSRHDGCFYGKIENIEDLVNYEGQTLEELENSFHEAVDDFIIFCKEVKKYE